MSIRQLKVRNRQEGACSPGVTLDRKKKQPASHPALAQTRVLSLGRKSDSFKVGVKRQTRQRHWPGCSGCLWMRNKVKVCVQAVKSTELSPVSRVQMIKLAVFAFCCQNALRRGGFPSLLSPSWSWLQSCVCSPSVGELSSDSPSSLPIKCNGAHMNTSEKKHLPLLI